MEQTVLNVDVVDYIDPPGILLSLQGRLAGALHGPETFSGKRLPPLPPPSPSSPTPALAAFAAFQPPCAAPLLRTAALSPALRRAALARPLCTGVRMGASPAEFVSGSLQENKVVVFSKSWCPFCGKAKQAISQITPNFAVFELDEREDEQEIQDVLGGCTGHHSNSDTAMVPLTHSHSATDTQPWRNAGVEK